MNASANILLLDEISAFLPTEEGSRLLTKADKERRTRLRTRLVGAVIDMGLRANLVRNDEGVCIGIDLDTVRNIAEVARRGLTTCNSHLGNIYAPGFNTTTLELLEALVADRDRQAMPATQLSPL